MTIKIEAKGTYPGSALSNFQPYKFVFCNVMIDSMEGFLQSLKFEDINEQKNVCRMVGYEAKAYAMKHAKDWREDQILFWNRTAYGRSSHEYFYLVKCAFSELHRQSDVFKKALQDTWGHDLIHPMGNKSKTETILTEREFVMILTEIRNQEKYKNLLTFWEDESKIEKSVRS
ncbi:GP30.3 family protein [Ralstonia phage RSP15]|uniref:GP30.3 family protein n=1 Tax=Ralstonia phage RSP15 TaxID=1785960 RepID=UPI00074D3E5F|nr:GP30.3 family protein [Ralstonia phage RSP15]BAU40068.1 GP30.3 family protein [Ralstonia phage RSP15]